MGDNTTAPLVLGAVYLLVWRCGVLGRWEIRSLSLLLLSGVLVGLAIGLKLTNAVSAVAICIALLACLPAQFAIRIRTAFLFGLGVVAGFSITGGIWMFWMWQEFGNPLFPQFGSIFPNSLASPISIADTRWLPRDIVEHLLWPFIISIDARRVSELSQTQIIWPMVYVLLILWLLQHLLLRTKTRQAELNDGVANFVIVFVVAAFVVWMQIFSISRYTVAFEVLAPLVAFIFLTRIFPLERARRAGAWLFTIAAVVVVVSGARTWGHEDWASPLYHTDFPAIEDPEEATVILTSSRSPLGWLATLHPPEVAFIGLGTAFPVGPAFGERAREIVRNRGGEVYVFTDAENSDRIERLRSYDELASKLRITSIQSGCDFLQFLMKRMRFRAEVSTALGSERLCQISVRAADKVDFDQSNKRYVQVASEILARDGFVLDADACFFFSAGIGSGSRKYQACRANLP